MGVEITSVDDCGVRILNVVAKSPAATGGLLGGDIIVAADCVSLASVHSMLNPTGAQASTSAPTGAATSANTPTSGLTSCTAPNPPSTLPILTVSSAGFNARGISLTFFTVIESRQPGDVILLTVQRKGQEFNFQITLGAVGNPTITPTATTAAPAGGPAQPSATGTAAATLPSTAESSATAALGTITATIAGSATASNATSTSTAASSTTTATAAGTTTGPTATP